MTLYDIQPGTKTVRVTPTIIQTAFLLLTCACVLTNCKPRESSVYREWHGETMGTYYTVKARTAESSIQSGIDSLLAAFNAVFSTYDTASSLSRFNRSAKMSGCLGSVADVAYLLEVTETAYRQTGGYFDPTVMPLVRYWGFAEIREQRSNVDSAAVDSLRNTVGWDKLDFMQRNGMSCADRSVYGVQLDFSAIAKGFGVDLVARYLETRRISDFMVEIGGEIVASGVSTRGTPWNIGIDKPMPGGDLGQRSNQAVITVDDMAVASSGNYRNFYELGGRVIGHTINPKTGYPEINDLLSVTVVAGECIYADALATGFMAMGYERARAAADSLRDVKVMFVRLDPSGQNIQLDYTGGMEEIVLFTSE